MVGLLILLGLFIIGDIYFYSAFKTALNNGNQSIGTYIYLISAVVFYAIVITFYVSQSLGHSLPKVLSGFMITIMIALVLFKASTFLFLLLEDIFRAGQWIISKVNTDIDVNLSRKRAISSIALIIGAIPFLGVIRGMLKNAYNFKVYNQKIEVPGLSGVFEKLNIVQISDLHTGSMLYPERLLNAVKIINDLQPDLVFFTGDIVNRITDEAYPFVNVLNKINAKIGVYSILGNHDYGFRWNNENDKKDNRKKMIALHKEKLGWDLLLNESRTIELGDHKLAIIGVENTSAKPYFGNYGDLNKASKNCADCEFKILLSHDPSHWQHEVVKEFSDIDLTLSGHTHGFQFGIEIPWLKWSPAKYMYKEWAGLYNKGKQFLYVNRGIGHLGYPGRVGILPEITSIKLVSS